MTAPLALTAAGPFPMLPPMANTSRLCLICGMVAGSDAERRDHMDAEHAGQRVAWHDRVPYVVAPDGTETKIGPAALKRMRRHARTVTGGRAATRGRAVVRKPEPTPAPVMVERPLPDDPDAPPYFEQVQPYHVTASETMAPEGPTAPTVESMGSAVSRETIKLALDQQTLASMIRQLSVVLSEWDGAGDRGHLSAIESAQLAMLIHEPAISAVQRYFGGNVDRFKLALALGILLLGKGRVHLTAIAAKRRTHEQAAEDAGEDAAYLATQPAMVTEVPLPEAAQPDPLAELAARQRAWNTTPRED